MTPPLGENRYELSDQARKVLAFEDELATRVGDSPLVRLLARRASSHAAGAGPDPSLTS
jgi:hypothetical protein